MWRPHRIILGNRFDNILNGSNHDDIILGFAGDDQIHAGRGNDVVFAGPGNDWVDGGDGNDAIFGDGGDDTLLGGKGNDDVNGGSGHDVVDGGDGNDLVYGDAGNDALLGGKGNDVLKGGSGRDYLVSGAGRDDLYGGWGADKFVIQAEIDVDTIHDFQRIDRIDLRDFNFLTAQDAIDAFRQHGHDAALNLGNGDKLIIEDQRVADLQASQFIVSDAETGPSSSQSPYIVSVDASISTVSLLTVGDSPTNSPDWQMVGIPDGLGAFDNGDGTFTVLMNHELSPTQGVARDHGGTGAFVSKLVIDTTTLEVLSGQDLIQEVYLYDKVNGDYDLTPAYQFNRLCSADLPKLTALYNPDSGLGYAGHVLLGGEENGPPFGDYGRAFAHFVDGANAGQSYELAWLGNNAFENVVASPYTGDETVVVTLDDTQNVNNGTASATGNGEVFFYFGTKQAYNGSNALEATGLTGGNLYAIQVAEMAVEDSTVASPLGVDNASDFNLVLIGDGTVNDLDSTLAQPDIQNLTDAAGATKFLRPEDGAWDTVNDNRFYFVTTGNISNPDAPSRLWAIDFNGVPSEAGLSGAVDGKIKLLAEGTEGQEMFDNLTVTKDGKVIIQEDTGNNAHNAKIWEYDPATDTLTVLAQHDPARFVPPVSSDPNFLTQDEESSGIIDVTDIIGSAGQNAYLLDVQAHYNIGGELVQGGQLLVMYQDKV